MPIRSKNSGPGPVSYPTATSPPARGAAVSDRIHVVIAAFNEQAAIGATVAALRDTYPHIIVVDDGSSDATAEAAHRAGATVLHHLFNRGQGAALQTGIEYALGRGAELVVTFDADGQHRVEDIPPLVAPIVDGRTDVALGSRFLGHAADIPPARRALLRAGLLFTQLTSGLRLTDTHNGLRAFSRHAASLLSLRQDRMAHASEILDRIRSNRLRYVEVPTRVIYTDYSRNKGQRARGALRIVFDYFVDKVLP